MPLVPATFLLIMAMSLAIIVWFVAREVAKRLAGPAVEGGAKRAPLRTSLEAH
jgi:hypothetical protein